jgi:hypothetical protein
MPPQFQVTVAQPKQSEREMTVGKRKKPGYHCREEASLILIRFKLTKCLLGVNESLQSKNRLNS